jgi:hypothetical protein
MHGEQKVKLIQQNLNASFFRGMGEKQYIGENNSTGKPLK